MITTNREVIDNFILDQDHSRIYETLSSNIFPWYLCRDTISGGINEPMAFYFTHTFYEDYKPISSFLNILDPILIKLDPKALIRVKANMYTITPEIKKHEMHVDQSYDANACLYFVNNNNGVTTFEDNGVEISSVANRALIFNSFNRHCSSSTTNTKFRLTININYF